jgi:hypothetical protein
MFIMDGNGYKLRTNSTLRCKFTLQGETIIRCNIVALHMLCCTSSPLPSPVFCFFTAVHIYLITRWYFWHVSCECVGCILEWRRFSHSCIACHKNTHTSTHALVPRLARALVEKSTQYSTRELVHAGEKRG